MCAFYFLKDNDSSGGRMTTSTGNNRIGTFLLFVSCTNLPSDIITAQTSDPAPDSRSPDHPVSSP